MSVQVDGGFLSPAACAGFDLKVGLDLRVFQERDQDAVLIVRHRRDRLFDRQIQGRGAVVRQVGFRLRPFGVKGHCRGAHPKGFVVFFIR